MDLKGIMLSEIRERKILCNLSYIWNLRFLQKLKIKKLIATKNRLVVARGRGWGMGEMGKGGQKFEKKKKSLADFFKNRNVASMILLGFITLLESKITAHHGV